MEQRAAAPSWNIAGEYSSRSRPGLVSIPRKDSRLFDAVFARSMIRVSGLPASIASSMCCADSGKRLLLTVTTFSTSLPAAPVAFAPTQLFPLR